MFGTNLRKWRIKRKLTQADLANKLSNLLGEEIKQINVGKWETGTNPKIMVIEAIAEVLNIPEQYLFDEKEEKLKKIMLDYNPNMNEALSNTKKNSFN